MQMDKATISCKIVDKDQRFKNSNIEVQMQLYHVQPT